MIDRLRRLLVVARVLAVLLLVAVALAPAIPPSGATPPDRPGGSSPTTGPGPIRELPRPTGAPTYDVVFTETGIPSSTYWEVFIVRNQSFPFTSTGAAAPSTASIALPNGTYVAIGGGVVDRTPSPASVNFTVDGRSLALTIVFTSAAPSVDTLILVEQGLGNGTSWGVNLSGSNRSATVEGPFGHLLDFVEPAGTVNYTMFAGPGYEPTAGSGNSSLTCPGPGDFCVVGADFTGVTEVTFRESGLPPGTNWSVRIRYGPTNWSTGSTIGFRLPNGTGYNFSVAAASALPAFPDAGTFNASETPVTIPIAFEPLTPVDFQESGLPNGTTWAVTLDGLPNASTSAVLGFLLPNGSDYPYEVGPIAGYVAQPAEGNVSVPGGIELAVLVPIRFLLAPSPLGARASLDVTAVLGPVYSCVAGTGQVRSTAPYENVSLNATAWNGTAPYRFDWDFGDGSPNATGALVHHTYVGEEDRTAVLTVVDAAGEENVTDVPVPFQALPVPPPICPTNGSSSQVGLTGPLEIDLAIAGVAALFVAVALVVRRRRKPSATRGSPVP